jgi:hypothetical protein
MLDQDIDDENIKQDLDLLAVIRTAYHWFKAGSSSGIPEEKCKY